MIDDYQQAMDLTEKMKAHLPTCPRGVAAYPGKGLIYTLKQQGIKIKKKKRLKIEDVHYLGDGGGISCRVSGMGGQFDEGKQHLVVSITHIRIPDRHPLAGEIRSYTLKRLRKIIGGGGPGSFRVDPKGG